MLDMISKQKKAGNLARISHHSNRHHIKQTSFEHKKHISVLGIEWGARSASSKSGWRSTDVHNELVSVLIRTTELRRISSDREISKGCRRVIGSNPSRTPIVRAQIEVDGFPRNRLQTDFIVLEAMNDVLESETCDAKVMVSRETVREASVEHTLVLIIAAERHSYTQALQESVVILEDNS